jgi:hypothetical protein
MSGISRRALLGGGAAAALGLGAALGSGLSWQPRRIAAQEGASVGSRARHGRRHPIDPAALEDLRARLNGTVMLPGGQRL